MEICRQPLVTAIENIMLGTKLTEFHTGYRAFSRKVLYSLPLLSNSDDFVFDNQMIVQLAAFKFRIGEISCPAKYFSEASRSTSADPLFTGLASFTRACNIGFGNGE